MDRTPPPRPKRHSSIKKTRASDAYQQKVLIPTEKNLDVINTNGEDHTIVEDFEIDKDDRKVQHPDFTMRMLRRIISKNRDILNTPENEKRLIDAVQNFCQKTRKEKVDFHVKNMVTRFLDEVKEYYEKNGESFSQCPVCLDPNIFSSRELKCKHTLCSACHDKLRKRCCTTENSVQCPICRKVTHIKLEVLYRHAENNDRSGSSEIEDDSG